MILTPEVVDVWSAGLTASPDCLRDMARLLSEDEQARAHRYRLEGDRRRFMVARAVLRLILSRYLDTPAARLRFQYTSLGKPLLAGHPAAGRLHFSLSHSQDLGLYVVALDRRVGIDVEWLARPVDQERISRRFFPAKEAAALAALDAEQRPWAFFAIWTGLEAAGKASGRGLAGRGEDSPWKIHSFAPHPGYIATLAVEGDGWRLRQWDEQGGTMAAG